MTIKETIGLHLSPPHVLEGKWRYSAFIAALRDARLATGRNPNTGDKINTLLLGSWLSRFLTKVMTGMACIKIKVLKIAHRLTLKNSVT